MLIHVVVECKVDIIFLCKQYLVYFWCKDLNLPAGGGRRKFTAEEFVTLAQHTHFLVHPLTPTRTTPTMYCTH